MLWPFVAVALAVFAQVAQGTQVGQGTKLFRPELLAWGATFLIQIVVFVFYTFLIELYREIVYIERELRPLVESIVGQLPFWKYEAWLKTQRGEGSMWWEYGTILLSAAALILAGSIRLLWHRGDYTGAVVNVFALLSTAKMAREAASLRKRFFSAG